MTKMIELAQKDIQTAVLNQNNRVPVNEGQRQVEQPICNWRTISTMQN